MAALRDGSSAPRRVCSGGRHRPSLLATPQAEPGAADTTIPLDNRQRLFEALQAASVPAELHAYAGVPPEFDLHAEFADDVASVGDFLLERYVWHLRTYPPFGLRNGWAAEPPQQD